MLSSAVGGGCLTSTGIGLASCPARELAAGQGRQWLFWLVELLAKVLKYVRSTLKRIVCRSGSAQRLNFGAHIGFVARQFAGELRHLRRDDTANGENNRKCEEHNTDDRNRARYPKVLKSADQRSKRKA